LDKQLQSLFCRENLFNSFYPCPVFENVST
jgi:hypothetical protein